MKKLFFLLLILGYSAGVYAQITVHGGFALSSFSPSVDDFSADSSVGFGGNLSLDYLLPSLPVSLGAEAGFNSASFDIDSEFTDTVMAIPILLRVAYHLDLDVPQLDLYLVGKMGYAVGTWSGDAKDFLEDMGADVGSVGGFAFGIDLGVAYYFTSNIGIFGEVGFDDYMLSSNVSGSTVELPFYQFFTLGVSLKI
ncbi:hypothetical protein FACS1894200_02780 [Spirochaetia bacterium]|nr:hypothetical protein FACS1894200_02780 [Spirochaetia bacterium]